MVKKINILQKQSILKIFRMLFILFYWLHPGFIFLQVACMQFINIVVHSVEDMNFRVHLQYDFTKLCLDDYLDVSKP